MVAHRALLTAQPGLGDLLIEVDGRDVTNFNVKQVKEMTKGAPGSPMKLKAQRGSNVYEVVLERSGGTGTSMASISDASSIQSQATGQVSKELTASERGKEGSEAALALHEELDRLKASLATMTGELSKAKEELGGVDPIKKELESGRAKLSEASEKAARLEAELEEAKKKLAVTAKSGDERVQVLEKAQRDMDDVMREQKKMAERQALDLDEAQTALRALYGAICKEGPAPVLGGIGIALGTEVVSVKGKQRKMVKVSQLATSGPAANAGVKVGDWLVEVDGKDVANVDVKRVKEMTRGAPGSHMRLKAQRGANGPQYDVVLERSGGTGASNASLSDTSSVASGLTPVKLTSGGKEPSPSDLGKVGYNAAVALHDQLERLQRSLAVANDELARSKARVSQQQQQEQQHAKASALDNDALHDGGPAAAAAADELRQLQEELQAARSQHAAELASLTARAERAERAAAAHAPHTAGIDGGPALAAPLGARSVGAQPVAAGKSSSVRRVELTVQSARHLPK